MKIFGIGLNKTGTRSLAHATRLLGYRTLHKGDAATNQRVIDAELGGEPLLQAFDRRFDAFFDVESIVRRFAELDRQYPGSRFILSIRPVDAWIASRRRHVLANQERAARGEYAGNWLIVDEAAWRHDWDQHTSAVREYFARRSDALLDFDVSRGDGWERLAPFLDTPIPKDPFPWENRAGEGTYRTQSHGSSSRLSRHATGITRRVRRRWREASGER